MQFLYIEKSKKKIEIIRIFNLCGRPPRYARPFKLTFDLLTLKVVSESRVTWDTSVPVLVFLGLFVLDLGPMYATDRQTSDALCGRGHNKRIYFVVTCHNINLYIP